MKRQKLNSRRTAALLASTLVLSQAEPILALADVKVETAAETVTDENTVVITSVDDLVQMSKNCVSESYSKGKTFVLTQDISLDGSDFQPVAVFAGNFQGNGHVISGLNITISGSNLGLFRYIEADGAVRGLIVKGNVKPDGSKKQIGGIVGTNRGTIENCEFHGMVSGQEAIGGIAGTNEEGAVIRGCKSYSVTTGNNKTGGITGNNDGTVEQCENHGDINASDQGVEDSNSGELSINTDKIKETVQKEKVNDAGGIAGYSKGKISDCKNYGTVGYEHIGYNIGGIAGRQCGIISQCYNLGDIRGRKDAGGIVGQFEPYLTIDHEEDLYDQLNSQLNSLSDISKALARTVDDTANKSTDSLDQIGDNMDQVRDIGKFYKDVYREDIDKMNNDLDSTTNDMQETLDHLHLRLIKDSSKSKVRALQQLLHDSDAIRKELKERYDGDLTDTDALKAWLQHRYELLSQLYENMQKVSEAVPDLMGSITEDSVNGVEDFGDKIEDLTSDINVMMDEIKYNRNNLKTDLENMDDELEVKIDSLADHVDSLQDSLKSGKDQTQAQRQQLEDQIDQIRNTITDKADEVRDKMEDNDLFDDVSDNDDQTELTDGTIYACVNTGSIEADYQAGGIAGIIGVEVSLDPEQDLDTDQEKTLNTVRQAKATVQGCLNEGDITGKRDYIGGVVGKANMGALISNQNYGDITSANGDYVGGITGSSDYVLRRNYSMCMVTGNDYIGGVAGWGKNVYENYALVTLTSDGGEWIGSIAGDGDTDGTVEGNYYVDGGIGAVDGITYDGQATGLSYDDFMALDQMPERFRQLQVSFLVDDNAVKTIYCEYGSSVKASEIPAIPQKDGYYYQWEDVDLSNITGNIKVHAVYQPYHTTIASDDDKMASLLAEAEFYPGSKLIRTETVLTGVAAPEGYQLGKAYDYEVTVPEEADVPDEVTLHLLAEGRGSLMAGMVKDGVVELLDTEVDGSYLVFTAPAKGTIVILKKSQAWKYAAAAGAAAVLAAVIGVVLVKKKRGKVHEEGEEQNGDGDGTESGSEEAGAAEGAGAAGATGTTETAGTAEAAGASEADQSESEGRDYEV